jgi:hypothetical protein
MNRHSSNAEHVRTLHLHPDVLADFLVRKPTSGRRSISKPTRLYKYTGIPVSGHARWSAKVMVQMLQVVGNMSGVANFSITTRGYSPPSQIREEIVTTGWAAFGSNVRSLTLVAPLRECNFPLNPALVFPTLEHLAIQLPCFNLVSSYNPDEATKLVRDLLVPFVNNHYSTLRSLELSLEIYGYSDVFTWFSGIHHLVFRHTPPPTFNQTHLLLSIRKFRAHRPSYYCVTRAYPEALR